MTSSLPTRRNLPLFMVAITLLLLMLAPALFACITPAHRADACTCCAQHPQPVSGNAACCSASHAPVALPATITSTERGVLHLFISRVPVLSVAAISTRSANQRIAAPPLLASIPLRI